MFNKFLSSILIENSNLVYFDVISDLRIQMLPERSLKVLAASLNIPTRRINHSTVYYERLMMLHMSSLFCFQSNCKGILERCI